uniref:BZIP domain-containing protein n=1 Tax=Enterobius vermicularis TaxID=51028 RepID=A0A0N4VA33_ENTVE
LNVEEGLSPPADVNQPLSEPVKFIDALPPVSQFSHNNTNQCTVNNYSTTKYSNERFESPSPPSSDCSSSLEPLTQILPCKARSKMHEMAVKQRLITDQDPRGNGFIHLSAEEKRTLLQEGYSLPTRLPLSKSEEDALKIVRRKIKNKLSAQESRRKRKEYMDTLEQRVQMYFSENSSLKAKIKQLEQSNRSLVVQLKKMQAALNAQQNNVGHQSPPCLSLQNDGNLK